MPYLLPRLTEVDEQDDVISEKSYGHSQRELDNENNDMAFEFLALRERVESSESNDLEQILVPKRKALS